MAEKCFYCGTELRGQEKRCPHCGADLALYRKIQETSDYYYNDGLSRAEVHDLSGAIQSLRKALQCDKYKTDARNLLGLVLFARGDMVEAMSEWVISKNLQKENNRADYYLKEIQRPGEIGRINSDIEKYNQALKYCKEGSRDLAKMQLRRIVAEKSTMVDAYQLLALILIQDQDYAGAAKVLTQASEIDSRNTLTLRYQKEISDILNRSGNKKKNRKKASAISFQDDIDKAASRRSLRSMLDDTGYTVLNIGIGLVIGLLICFFLVVPTVRQQARNDAAKSVVTANEKVTNTSNSVSQLQDQVKSLKSELEKYTGKSDVVTSYEQLIQANNAVASNDLATAGTLLSSVNRDLLQDQGKAVYDSVSAAVNQKTLDDAYNAGVKAYNSKDYATAITQLTQVTQLDEKYKDGDALYRLGQAYERNNNTQEAVTAYNRVSELFPNTSVASRAASRASKLQSTTQAQ